MAEFIPVEAFPVGKFVAEELETRGWTTAHAATLLDGDPVENELWLRLLCCLPAWEKHNVVFSEREAKELEQLFGVSAQTWLNLDVSYRKWKESKR